MTQTHLLKRPKASRERDETARRHLAHESLALMHPSNNGDLGPRDVLRVSVTALPDAHESLGDHAEGRTAGLDARGRDEAHEALGATAIDERDASSGQSASDGGRGLGVDGRVPEGGCATGGRVSDVCS
jgi:hypothetical protein